MTSLPGRRLQAHRAVLQTTTTDDDRRQRPLLVLPPYTMCRRASNKVCILIILLGRRIGPTLYDQYILAVRQVATAESVAIATGQRRSSRCAGVSAAWLVEESRPGGSNSSTATER